jgi:hypothetical protein
MNHYRIFYRPLGGNEVRVKQGLKEDLDDMWAFRQKLNEHKIAHKTYEWDSISETWTDTYVGYANSLIDSAINAGYKIIIDE